MSRILPLLFSLCLLAGPLLADEVADFAEANRLYESGDFAGATTAYRKLADAGLLSPDLFYNLGAALHRLGNDGEAVLWMRRARYLEPGMPEAVQSLAFLRTRLAFFEFADKGLDRVIAAWPEATFTWILMTAFWTAALSAVAAFAIPRLQPNRSAMITLSVVLLMFAVVAWRADLYREKRLDPKHFATITVTGTSATTAPLPDAKEVVALPPGSEVRLLQQAGAWVYAEIPGDLRGWLRKEAVSPLWPESFPYPEAPQP